MKKTLGFLAHVVGTAIMVFVEGAVIAILYFAFIALAAAFFEVDQAGMFGVGIGLTVAVIFCLSVYFDLMSGLKLIAFWGFLPVAVEIINMSVRGMAYWRLSLGVFGMSVALVLYGVIMTRRELRRKEHDKEILAPLGTAHLILRGKRLRLYRAQNMGAVQALKLLQDAGVQFTLKARNQPTEAPATLSEVPNGT